MQRLFEEIDEMSKLLVFGYIRLSNPQSIIPIDICYLCLLFYHLIPEQFIYFSKKLELSSSDEKNNKINDIVQIQAEQSSLNNLQVHGNVIINPTKNPDVIAEWTIESNVKWYAIGIKSKYNLEAEIDYAWDGRKISSGKLRKGDTIKMELNIPNKSLTYYKNDKLMKDSFSNIDVSKEYHLAIEISEVAMEEGDNVKLIDFSVKQYKSLSFYREFTQ